jgi:nucleoside-diphosphate-sugar epimerase
MSEQTSYRCSPAPAGPSPERTPSAHLCLITGASGFIGGRLAERLVDEGYPVRCLVRASSDTSRLEQLGVQLAAGDLADAHSLARAVKGAHNVLHCAALVTDWATTEELKRTNVEGTRKLLDASVGASVGRFIHFSTTDIYGYPDGAEIDESHTATRFRNWYAQTKLEAEVQVRRVERADSLDTVILRPATVYGPGSTDVVGEIACAIKGGHMLLIDRGRAVAGLCYVENLIDAAVLALRHDAAPGHAFNVSDGLPVTWRQFCDDLSEGLGASRVGWSLPYWLATGIGFSLEHGYRLLRRATGVSAPPLLSRQAVQVLGENQDFSNRRLRETLGWEPRVDYATGLALTLAWLRTEHLAPT